VRFLIRLQIGVTWLVVMAVAMLALLVGDLPLPVKGALIALVVVAGALGFSAAASVLRLLEGIAATSRAISSGQLGERVHRPRGALREPANVFNDMAAELQSRIESGTRARNRLMAALNSSIDAIVAVDGEGRVTFANSAAAALFGKTEQEMEGNPFVWLMASEKVVEALRVSREEGRRESLIIERPNRRYLSVIVSPIVGGGAWSSLVVMHDLTEMKRVEQVRRDFVANVSHELRTPLAALKSVIETLQGGAVEDRDLARDFLSRADSEVDRLVQMVEELLELSRIESGEVPMRHEPVDMAAIVWSAAERLRPQAQRQGLSLSVKVAGGLPAVMGDAVRLERAVINLIQNSLKFTPAGGCVDVEAHADSGSLSVIVSDTGVGIEPEDLPRVFERFYKGDRARGGAGSGLGLALVKHTAEAHGGAVRVESEPGKGSRFTLSVPLDHRPLTTESTAS
jgi:two-component system phosphate regulon sensor histidine kinase PhoR